jgi:hypothetical protein
MLLRAAMSNALCSMSNALRGYELLAAINGVLCSYEKGALCSYE